MIPDRHSSYPFAALTNTGLVRKTNEDRYAITAFHSSGHDHTPGLLAILSDGVGGESGGEVAAEIAVETIVQQALANRSEDPAQVLPAAIRAANDAVLDAVQNHPSLTGMAATVACAWINGDQLSIATLGDTRIYLLRGADQVVQLSTDHTWVQEAIDSGSITDDQKENHPRAHVIRRFLGSENPPEPDMTIKFSGQIDQEFDLLQGDIVFMCTDGVSDLVSPQEIRTKFSGQKLEKSLEEIKKLALARGGRDNLTMIAIQIPQHLLAVRRRPKTFTLVMIFLAILLAIALGFYLAWWSERNPIRGTSEAAFTPQQISATIQSALPTMTPVNAGGEILPTPSYTGGS